MKNIKILSTIVLIGIIFLTACQKETNNDVIKEQNNPKLKQNALKSAGSSVTFKVYQDLVIILDKSDNEIYFMQTEEDINFTLSSLASNVQIDQNFKIIIEHSVGNNVEYDFDSLIYGIGQISYQSGQDMGLIIESGGNYDLNNDEEYYPPIKCGCFRSGTHGTPTNCTGGGEGSTSCSASSGGNSCSAGCGSGYFSCCTIDADFTYE